MKFSIIIPCHQDNAIVRECIKKILIQKNHEVIIACDNFDFDFDYSETNVKIIKSSKKLFANGIRNLGAKSSEGDYLIFIDSDIIVEDDFIIKIEDYIKNYSPDILNFPTKAENSNNIFAIYKGYKENYQTYYFLKKIIKKLKSLFLDTLCFSKKLLFLTLKVGQKKQILILLWNMKVFKKIYKSNFVNEVAFDIQVNHYHHQNLKLFTNIIYRTAIWTIKKLRKEVDIDSFKSKKNGLISITIFLLIPSLLINTNFSIFLLIVYLILDMEFLIFLFKKNKLFFLMFFLIHLIYLVCVSLGALKGVKDFIFKKK